MRERRPPEERFWEKVDRSGDCWLWTGAINEAGYGHFWDGYKIVRAHRWLWEQTNGAAPILDHLCRVRHCVRLEHLEPVTNQENVRRGWNAVRQGRCIHGHEMTEENTYVTSRGARQCRTCKRAAMVRWQARTTLNREGART